MFFQYVNSEKSVCWVEKPSVWKPLIHRRGGKSPSCPTSKDQPCLLNVRTFCFLKSYLLSGLFLGWWKCVWEICLLCVQMFWETPSCIWQRTSCRRSRTTNRFGTWERRTRSVVTQRSLRVGIRSPSTVAMTPRRDITKQWAQIDDVQPVFNTSAHCLVLINTTVNLNFYNHRSSTTIWPTALRFWRSLAQVFLDKSSNAGTTRPWSWWLSRSYEAKKGKTSANQQHGLSDRHSLTYDDHHQPYGHLL